MWYVSDDTERLPGKGFQDSRPGGRRRGSGDQPLACGDLPFSQCNSPSLTETHGAWGFYWGAPLLGASLRGGVYSSVAKRPPWVAKATLELKGCAARVSWERIPR